MPLLLSGRANRATISSWFMASDDPSLVRHEPTNRSLWWRYLVKNRWFWILKSQPFVLQFSQDDWAFRRRLHCQETTRCQLQISRQQELRRNSSFHWGHHTSSSPPTSLSLAMCGDCFGLLASSSGSLEKGVHIPTKEPDSTAPRKLSITSTDLTPQHKFNEISKVGWLLKREKKKFLVMSSERVFCLLKGGVLYYFRAQKATPKDCEQGEWMELPPGSLW